MQPRHHFGVIVAAHRSRHPCHMTDGLAGLVHLAGVRLGGQGAGKCYPVHIGLLGYRRSFAKQGAGCRCGDDTAMGMMAGQARRRPDEESSMGIPGMCWKLVAATSW